MFVPPWTYQELADACNADSDDMEMKFMSILCTRSFPHLRKGKNRSQSSINININVYFSTFQYQNVIIPTPPRDSQYSRSSSDAPTRTLNRSSRRRCREMSKMPFMPSVMTVYDLILLLSVPQCLLLTTCIMWHLSRALFAVRSVKNQPSYFADRLYKAMKVFVHNALNMASLCRYTILVCRALDARCNAKVIFVYACHIFRFCIFFCVFSWH